MRYLSFWLLAICLGLAGPAGAENTAQQLVRISEGEHRSAEHRARNQYRHPVATLQWFGVEPDMTVVEIWPGGGWYTEILAPYLRNSGSFYAADFAVSQEITPEWRHEYHRKFVAKLKERPQLYDQVKVTELGPTEAWTPAPPGSADAVLTFRNVHNWVKGGYEQQMFDAFYKTLKPGGVLGVVEHRADPGASLETMKQSGYVTQGYVTKLAARAGFEFVDSTEINANPKDDHHHPEGVWTLPPSLRLEDKNRDKYLAIGESDRMTLKFRKPE